MAVLSGERLEHPDGLLPGAWGAALLWQGTALAGGALLGAGQVYGGAAPFEARAPPPGAQKQRRRDCH